jgi:hypothetical protein
LKHRDTESTEKKHGEEARRRSTEKKHGEEARRRRTEKKNGEEERRRRTEGGRTMEGKEGWGSNGGQEEKGGRRV